MPGRPGPAGRLPGEELQRDAAREQGVLPEDEGRLLPLPGRGGHGREAGGGGGVVREVVQRGARDQQGAHAAHPPHPAGAGAQLLGVLLRDPERAGPGVPPGQDGLRRRHRRAGHPERGLVQRLYAHHAAAAGQPDSVDQ